MVQDTRSSNRPSTSSNTLTTERPATTSPGVSPAERTPLSATPTVSVVIEGFNEDQEQGVADNTVAALMQQDYPLDKLEVILVGSAEQATEWQEKYGGDKTPFLSFKTVAAEGAIYYQLKNLGAQEATCEIVVFTDSDVCPKPTWASALVAGLKSGADVSVGITLFKDLEGLTSNNLLHKITVCITFGYLMGRIFDHRPGQIPQMEVRGFVGHNVAMPLEIFRESQYRTEFGRLIASPLLFANLASQGYSFVLHPKQRVVHYFEWLYWVRLHYRFGYEVYQLRRLDKDYPNQWITKLGLLEAPMTMIWHMLLDIPRWFRFSRLLEMNVLTRVGLFPAVLVLSAVARGAEMFGMFATILTPEAMQDWAENGKCN
ncbi:MAG: glycosyltransferase family 2 protein [Phormidesmis sp.]